MSGRELVRKCLGMLAGKWESKWQGKWERMNGRRGCIGLSSLPQASLLERFQCRVDE